MPGTHFQSYVAAKKGLRIGTKASNTEVVDEDGKIKGEHLEDNSVDYDALTDNAVWSSVMGWDKAYAKDYDDNVDGDDVLVADPGDDGEIVIIVTCTVTFDGAVPKFKIGNEAGGDQFMDDDVFVDGTPKGFQHVITGELDTGSNDIVNVNSDSGADTGTINVLVLWKDAS